MLRISRGEQFTSAGGFVKQLAQNNSSALFKRNGSRRNDLAGGHQTLVKSLRSGRISMLQDGNMVRIEDDHARSDSSSAITCRRSASFLRWRSSIISTNKGSPRNMPIDVRQVSLRGAAESDGETEEVVDGADGVGAIARLLEGVSDDVRISV